MTRWHAGVMVVQDPITTTMRGVVPMPLESAILEGNQFVDPPCNPGEVVTFHSMTHDPGAVYKGYLEGIDTHRGRKAGIATITFTA